jgi:hypothetical protein
LGGPHLDANNNLEVDSLPSDLSGDEWHEIVMFEKEKFEEDKQK